MIYPIIPKPVKMAHLMLGYAHHFQHLLKYLRSHIRMILKVTEQKAQLIIELSDVSINPVCLNGLKCKC